MNTPIYSKLLKLKNEKRIPFHMPGHKRRGSGVFKEIEKMDITEITDYDNLHHPEGIIRESMDHLREIYGTRESWYLVNGSTVGILAAISACCDVGDGILLSRNCHKSVYNAVRLLHLHAYYFYPEISDEYDVIEGIEENQIEEIREILNAHREIKAVILPSPTYEGVVMDIEKLRKAIEPYQVFFIVDEAHGAHFPFHEYFPKSATECGADLVIQSTHKTLPAMTQTALLHLCSDRISPEIISNMLSVYESSSPSYILMASAEYSVAYMKENVDAVQQYVDNLQNFRKKCAQLRRIHVIDREDLRCRDYDRSKLVFSVKNTGWNGITLFERLLRDYHIELEMSDSSNCIAMTSVCDSEEMYDALFDALKGLDEEIDIQMTESRRPEWENNVQSYISCGKKMHEKVLESWQCERKEKEKVILDEAEGRISGDYVMLYPPGIPLLVPGEKILKETVENLRYYIYNGYNVLGLSGDHMIVLR